MKHTSISSTLLFLLTILLYTATGRSSLPSPEPTVGAAQDSSESIRVPAPIKNPEQLTSPLS